MRCDPTGHLFAWRMVMNLIIDEHLRQFARTSLWIAVLLCSFGALQLRPTLAGQGPSDESLKQAVVTRNVRLHPAASASSKTLMVLSVGEILELIEDNPTDGFYHVQTEGGDEGWVSERYVRIQSAPIAALAAANANANPVGAISDAWQKPTPNKTTFTGPDGSCPWNGNGSDPNTFLRKNRSDEPGDADMHDVAWSAIHDLSFPKDKPLRINWSPEHLQEIARFEGIAVRTVGYIVAVKPQNGHGEGTNCGFKLASETDTHIALVGEQGDAEKNSVVIEFTPRFLKAHPHWNKTMLSKYTDTNVPVRVTGWLMLDPDHRNHLNRYRFTLWEIHPITKIEVLSDGQWQNLDAISK